LGQGQGGECTRQKSRRYFQQPKAAKRVSWVSDPRREKPTRLCIFGELESIGGGTGLPPEKKRQKSENKINRRSIEPPRKRGKKKPTSQNVQRKTEAKSGSEKWGRALGEKLLRVVVGRNLGLSKGWETHTAQSKPSNEKGGKTRCRITTEYRSKKTQQHNEGERYVGVR